MARSAKRARTWLPAALAAGVLALAAAVLPSTGATGDTYPSLDEIEAAKAAVANQQASVEQLDDAIVQLESAAQAAQDAASLAAENYLQAQETADTLRDQAELAAASAKDANAQLDSALSQLGELARQAYRNGGSLTQFEAVVGANGFEEVIGRAEFQDRAAQEYDAITQRVEAAEVVAQSAAELADESADRAEKAAADARSAWDEAQTASQVADQAVADAEATRQEAVSRLAQLQRTSVALEEQRQQGLASERAQRDREAYEQALQEAQAGGSGSGSGGTGGSPGGAGSGSGGTGGSGTQTPAPQPTTPAPQPTTPPVVTTPSTGAWKSTAAQGEGASAHAQTLMGLPYLLGGNGPAYDCSGITYAAWKSQGITLPRSSKSQYFAVAHVALSEMRPGDLVFYGTNRDPNQIYHVAIYIGNGMVAEATSPGKVSTIRAYDLSWRINNLIPYAGRP